MTNKELKIKLVELIGKESEHLLDEGTQMELYYMAETHLRLKENTLTDEKEVAMEEIRKDLLNLTEEESKVIEILINKVNKKKDLKKYNSGAEAIGISRFLEDVAIFQKSTDIFRGSRFVIFFNTMTKRVQVQTIYSNQDINSLFLEELNFFKTLMDSANIDLALLENKTEEDEKTVIVRNKGKIKKQMKLIEVKSQFKRSNLEKKIEELLEGEQVTVGVLTYKLQ